METVNMTEQTTSHVPALQQLCKLGYQYLTPQEALALRSNNTAQIKGSPL